MSLPPDAILRFPEPVSEFLMSPHLSWDFFFKHKPCDTLSSRITAGMRKCGNPSVKMFGMK